MVKLKSAELMIVRKRFDEIRPHPKNPRVHDEKQIKKLRHSIRVHGFSKGSIVIQKSTGYILAGHGIVEALKLEGYNGADVVEADLPDGQAEAFLISDNHVASQSEWDNVGLQQLINELSEMNIPSLDFGFDSDDLEKLASDILSWNPNEQDMPNLADGDRQPFQQMTFVLSDDQAETVKKAMQLAKDNGDFTDTINENSNGNALARIAEAYLG